MTKELEVYEHTDDGMVSVPRDPQRDKKQFVLVAELAPYMATLNLGCATTVQLINELQARVRVSQMIGEAWPNYRAW